VRASVMAVWWLACRGPATKPASDGATDGDREETGPTTVPETTADTGTPTTDTWGPYTRAVRAWSVTGQGLVEFDPDRYSGVEIQAFENHVGRLCTVVFQAGILDASWEGPPPVADHGACEWLGQPCTFSFDLVMKEPTEDAFGSDCEVFGLYVDELEPYQVSYAFVDQVLLQGTPPGGGTTYSYRADLLLTWLDGYGWYPLYDGLFAGYFGLPDTRFDGAWLTYTARFAEYY
jgi:hypothetical protein